MTVRLSSPYRNLGNVDLKRDSRVKFDKVIQPVSVLPLTLQCPDTTLIATCSTISADTVNVQFIAAGGVLPYTFALIAGVLPATLTLNPATGRIEGNTTTFPPTGNFPITVRVTDAVGSIQTVACTLTVAFCDTNAANLAVKHPITTVYANPGFFSGDFIDVAPFVVGPVTCAPPVLSNCTAGMYLNAGELESHRGYPVGTIPALIPPRNCPAVATSPVMKIYSPAPETMNHEASVTVGSINEPLITTATPVLAATCRIHKVNPVGPNDTSNYSWVAFAFTWFGTTSPQLIILDSLGGITEIHGAAAAVNAGDVLTLVCVCTRAFGFVNGVLKLQKSILCSSGRPGIFNYNTLPDPCVHTSISNWGAALRQ